MDSASSRVIGRAQTLPAFVSCVVFRGHPPQNAAQRAPGSPKGVVAKRRQSRGDRRVRGGNGTIYPLGEPPPRCCAAHNEQGTRSRGPLQRHVAGTTKSNSVEAPVLLLPGWFPLQQRSRSSRRCARTLSRSERPNSRAGREISGSEALMGVAPPDQTSSPICLARSTSGGTTPSSEASSPPNNAT
jgi:hypothetical protein